MGTGSGKPSVGKEVTCVSVMPLITHTGHGCLSLSRDLASTPEGGCEGRRPILHLVALYLSASLPLPIHQPPPFFFFFSLFVCLSFSFFFLYFVLFSRTLSQPPLFLFFARLSGGLQVSMANWEGGLVGRTHHAQGEMAKLVTSKNIL